jgi:hypothetical protein
VSSPPIARGPAFRFAALVLGMLAVFRALDVAVARLVRLPASSYEEATFLDNLVLRWWHLVTTRIPWWLSVAGLAVFAVAAVIDARRFGGAGRRRVFTLFAGWNAIEDGASLRLWVMSVTGVAAWALSSYANNLYVDQMHVAERVIVIGLWLMIAWRPVFVFPFVLVAVAVAGQFVVPLGFFSWTEMDVVLRFPVLFGAWWVVRTLTGERRSDLLIFGWCCLLATTYWTSGLGKLRVGWLTHPHLDLLFLGATANGWLSFLDPATVQHAAVILSHLAWPLMLLTLVLECGALIMLFRRWSLVGFLSLAIIFHLGVFAITGIFFWKWILCDAFLLTYLLRGQQVERLAIFTPTSLAVSVAAIVAGPLWVSSVNLTWFDTPLTYSIRFEGVDTLGAAHELPAGFFRPFTEALVLQTFPYLTPNAQLTQAMGVTMDRQLAESLEASRSAEEVLALEATAARRVDPAASAAFDEFVSRYAAHARCGADRDPPVLRVLGAPRHLWTFPLQESLPCGVALGSVRVFELTSFYDGTSVRLMRRQLLRTIDARGRRRSK